ncbi:hypothetical protein BSKO_12116 [Bryopsis sp. KO-2023]|nr:hypothetical protein BSKO_12116 [Bryopsis sp. KO-2023]
MKAGLLKTTAGFPVGQRCIGVRPRMVSVSRDSGRCSVIPSAKKSLSLVEVTDILRMVNDTDIVEFELKQKGLNLSVKKQEAIEPTQVVPQVVAAPAAAPAAAAPAAAPAAAAPLPPPAEAPSADPPSSNGAPDGLQIASPMAGTYYSSPAPGEPMFVKVGDKVIAGQTICIIEAMKLMNEIEADVSGEVVSILKTNGDSVTAGDPIIIIRA